MSIPLTAGAQLKEQLSLYHQLAEQTESHRQTYLMPLGGEFWLGAASRVHFSGEAKGLG